jgi:ectoine hydroxylase-related dioxygenase (phytanoyl-CoA dioxygenase family)
MQLTTEQQNFFEAFGFLHFPGLLHDQIETITQDFRGVFDDNGIEHDASQRTCLVPFIDRREKLCALLDNEKIIAIASGLLGENWNYTGSDGNYYTGDTMWHSDGYHAVGRHIKIAFYLDEVTRETGALRVIPGSHRLEMRNWPARQAANAPELWGIAQNEVPSFALESSPGDVVVFNHNLMHAAFGGSSERRMFTINLCRHANSEAELDDLKDYISQNARFWIDHMHGETMVATASPQRQKHLQQVMENESHLPALAAKARLEMSEPSRG